MRVTKVALALAVFFLMTGAGFAQAPWWQGNGNNGYWGYQNGRDNAYERGVRDGRKDREHGRSWHPRNQGQAYLNGYRAGYGTYGGYRGGNNPYGGYGGNYPYGGYGGNYPYGGYGGNYPYGGYGGNYPYGGYGGNDVGSLAYNNGYREGLGYGERDRSSGRRPTPTDSGVYRDATSGYNSSYGDRSSYRITFRQGFVAGYQRGYNGGYGGGRRY